MMKHWFDPLNSFHKDDGSRVGEISEKRKSKYWISGNVLFMLNFARLLLIHPSKICFNSFQGRYEFKPSIVRKIITIFFISGLYLMVTVESVSNRGENWVSLIHHLTWLGTSGISVTVFWKHVQLQELVSLIYTVERKLEEYEFPLKFGRKWEWVSRLGLVGITVWTLGSVLQWAYVFEEVPISGETIKMSLSLRSEIGLGQVVFNSTKLDEIRDLPISWLRILHGSFITLIALVSIWTELFSYMILVATNTSTWFLVLDLLDHVMLLFGKIDETLGYVIVSMCFVNLPFYITSLKKVFMGESFFSSALQTSIVVVLGGTVPAASTASMLKFLPGWFKRKAGEESLPKGRQDWSGGERSCGSVERRVDLCLQELAAGDVGIRGKMFTITFSFIGQIFGLALTYAVLLFQLKEDQ